MSEGINNLPITKGLRVDQQIIDEAEAIGKMVGLHDFPTVTRYCIRQVYKSLQKEAS